MLFDPEVANMIQYISLPLEIIGFALALIELRFPHLAFRLKKRVLSWPILLKKPEKNKMFESIPIIHFVLAIVIVIGCVQYFVKAEHNWDFWSVFFDGFMFILMLTFLNGAVQMVFIYLELYAKQNVLGLFGMILAILGLSGEIYQFLSSFLN